MPQPDSDPEKSLKDRDSHKIGKCYVVATPIGNLDDITARGIKTLKECDLIAAEDTRQTKKLLNRYDIPSQKCRSLHEHSAPRKIEELFSNIREGSTIAIVSDAGTPAISDPGMPLISRCLDENYPVIPIPGASSLTAAISVSGFDYQHFLFWRFLPRKEKAFKYELQKATGLADLHVAFESPHRLIKTLRILKNEIPKARLVICRELTKKFEEVKRGSPEQIYEVFKNRESVKGEIVLVFKVEKSSDHSSKNTNNSKWSEEDILRIGKALSAHENLGSKDLSKWIAKRFGLNKKEAYDLALRSKPS